MRCLLVFLYHIFRQNAGQQETPAEHAQSPLRMFHLQVSLRRYVAKKKTCIDKEESAVSSAMSRNQNACGASAQADTAWATTTPNSAASNSSNNDTAR